MALPPGLDIASRLAAMGKGSISGGDSSDSSSGGGTSSGGASADGAHPLPGFLSNPVASLFGSDISNAAIFGGDIGSVFDISNMMGGGLEGLAPLSQTFSGLGGMLFSNPAHALGAAFLPGPNVPSVLFGGGAKGRGH